MKKIWYWGRYVLVGSSVALLGLSAVLLFAGRSLGGIRFYSVASGSMAPAIPSGSLVMTKARPVVDLKVGEVITFLQPGYADRYVTHRINRIQLAESHLQFVTKGDANSVEDIWLITPDNIKGVVAFSVPILGRVSQLVHSRLGVILGVILPVGVLLILELKYLLQLLVEDALEETLQPTPLV